MTQIKLFCQGATARARVAGAITAGAVGIPVEIVCDSAWDGLTRTIVFMTPVSRRSVAGVTDTAQVAPEVLVQGMHLYLGMEGRDDEGNVVIPTNWADCGVIRSSSAGTTEMELPAIPGGGGSTVTVTEQMVASWGFTKNTGTYSKPDGGIPASDLAAGVIPDVSGLVKQEDYAPGAKTEAMTQPVGRDDDGRLWVDISGCLDKDPTKWPAWSGTQQEAARAALGGLGGEPVVPSYVVAEADAVIDRVMAAQGNRTFTLAAIADMHYGRGGYHDGFDHGVYALKYIDSLIGLDALAVLGDYTDYRPTEGIEKVIEDFRAVNQALSGLRHIPNLRMHGNHDYWEGHAPEVFRYTGSLSDGEAWGHAADGYYYRDFDRVKLRVIVLNLVGDETGNVRDSAAQAQWFADSLDLSSRADAAQWQILVLSHQPVDYWRTADSLDYALPNIIDAYIQGGSYSTEAVSCHFAGKNDAKFIGNIHGHLHNLLVDRIYNGECSVSSQINALRISTPEAVYGRTGDNESVWESQTNYPKVQNTSWDTSFVIYCIDLDEKTIHAVCYGAGCHRTIDYDALTWTEEEKEIIHGGESGGGESGAEKPEAPTYTNWIPIATDENGSTVTDGMLYPGMRWKFGSNELAEAEGHWISGFIPAKVGDMIRVRWNNYYTQTSGYISIHAFDASKQRLATGFSFNQMNTPEWEGLDFQNAPGYRFDYENGSVDFTIPECGYTPSGTAYLAFCLAGDSQEAIVTVNEEIS